MALFSSEPGLLTRFLSPWNVVTDMQAAPSSGFLNQSPSKRRVDIAGSYSGGKIECDEGISLGILLATLAGIAVMFFTLYTKITKIGRRRRRYLEAAADPISTQFLYSGTRTLQLLFLKTHPTLSKKKKFYEHFCKCKSPPA